MAHSSPFSYLAFDETSKAVLGHGFTATEALSKADSVAPSASIYILEAGTIGWKIWRENATLLDAEKIIEGIGLATFWLRLTGGRKDFARISG
jgi:hypothetical protein